MPRRIAIIGGGISGLAVAYELSRQTHSDFTLFEASSRLGGIVETVHHGEFIIECGPDSWVSEKPWARELAVELGLEAELLPSNDEHRRTYLLQGEELIAMPDGMRMMVPSDLSAIADSPLFSPRAVQAYQREPSRAEELKSFAQTRNLGDDESVASFVGRHFGEEVTRQIAGPLLAGVFGGDIERLSAHSTMPGLVKLEREHGSLVLALQHQTANAAATSSVFTSLRGGLQILIDAMEAATPSASIHLNEAVTSLERESAGWQVTTSSARACFDAIILATPVDVTRRLIAAVDPELGELLSIDATSAIIVAVAFDREQAAGMNIPEGFGFLAPQAEKQPGREPSLLACTFVDQKFSHRAPNGAVLLRGFYGGDAALALISQTDEAISTLAQRQLSRILGTLPQPHFEIVRRWPRSLPQYAVGHRRRIAQIESIVSATPGLYLAGNAWHGVGLPDLIRDGRAIARRLRSQ